MKKYRVCVKHYVLFLVMVLTIQGWSQTNYSWIGGSSGDWDTASNWSPSGIPGSADSITISSGEALLGSDKTISGITLIGKIGGSGNLSVTGNMTWQDGIIEGSGMLTIESGAVMRISTSEYKELIGRGLENKGTIYWDGGDIKVRGDAPVINQSGATFNIRSDEIFDFILPDSGGTFTNYGSIVKSAGIGTAIMDLIFVNAAGGTVQVNSGNLKFERGSDTPSAGTYTASNGQFEFAKSAFLFDGATFNGSDTVEVIDASLSASGAGLTIDTGIFIWLRNSDARLEGDGPIVVNGIVDLERGKIAGSGAFTVNGGMVFTGSSSRTIDARTVTNYGDVTYLATGTLRLDNGAAFVNKSGATYDLQTDANLDFSDAIGGSFTNDGTFTKSAGTGTMIVDVAFQNNGVVNLNSGFMELTRGGGSVNGLYNTVSGSKIVFDDEAFVLSNVQFGGAGTVEFSTSNIEITGLGMRVLSDATLDMPAGMISGSGEIFIDGTFNWMRGALTGSGDITNHGQLNITGSNFKELVKRDLDNKGTLTWTGGNIKFKDSAKLTNDPGSLFDIQTDGLIDYVLADDGGVFVNKGILRKSAGTGTATIDPIFYNTGDVEVNSGTLRFERGSTNNSSKGDFITASGCTLVFSERSFMMKGAEFQGSGTVEVTDATMEIKEDGLEVDDGVTLTINDTNALLEGDGPTIINGTLDWWQGVLNGTGALIINNTLKLSGSHFKVLNGRTLTNNGTTLVTGTGSLRFQENAVFENNSGAVFEFQSPATMVHVAPSGGTINNNGTIRTQANIGEATVDVNLVNNNLLEINDNSTLKIGSNGNLAFGQGTVSGNGTIDVSGIMSWDDGSFAGTGDIVNHGTLNINGTTQKMLDARSLINYNKINLQGSGDLTLKNNAMIENQASGIFTVSGEANFPLQGPNEGSIVNHGNFIHDTGGTLAIDVDMNNFGILNAATGTIDFNKGLSNAAGATIKGSGIVDIADATFSNSGSFHPGSSPGILRLNGDYSGDATSSINIEIAGRTPGSGYDKLVVSGNATLGATLNVDLLNLYVPAVGDTFRIMSYPSGSGFFQTINTPLINGQPVFTVNYDDNGVILTSVSEVYPPEAVNDPLVTNEDSDGLVNVLRNDNDPEGSFLTIMSFGQGSNGVVTMQGDSTFRYQPFENFFGADTFQYTIRNANNLLDSAMVLVDVLPVNDAPTVIGIPNVSFTAGASKTIDLDNYANDIDNTLTSLSWQSSVISSSQPVEEKLSQGKQDGKQPLENANLQISIDPTTHVATISTAPGITGTFTVAFTATDPGNASASDTMQAIVGGLPSVINPIADRQYPEDSGTHTVVSDLDSVFADPDGSSLNYGVSSNNPNIPASLVGRKLNVAMAAEYSGMATITATAEDGDGNVINDVFTVTINPVNDPPVITPALVGITFPEDGSYNLDLSNHSSDIDNAVDDLSWSAQVLTASGIPNENTREFRKGKDGSVIEIDTDDLLISIDPNTQIATFSATGDSSGTFTVKMILSDPDGLSDTQDIFVFVEAANDQPVLANPIGSQSFPEDSAPVMVVSDLNTVFSDPDPDDVLAFSVGSDNSDIQASLQGNSLFLSASTDYNGSANITVSATDDGSTFIDDSFVVTVQPVNDAPVIADLSAGFTMLEEDTLTVFLDTLVSDVDNNITTLSWALSLGSNFPLGDLTISLDTTSHILTIIPNDNVSFKDAPFELMVCDPANACDTSASTLTVSEVNDLPYFSSLPDSLVFASDSSAHLMLWDFVEDVETADSLLAIQLTGSSNQVARVYNADTGKLSFFSMPGFFGTVDIGIFVTDEANATVSDTLRLVVNPLTGIIENPDGNTPMTYGLSQNYPNPFNPNTAIKFQIPEAADVSLIVYNMLGQKVRTLVNGRLAAGYHEAVWDATNSFGRPLASGIYIYRLQAGNYQKVMKMILLK